MAYFITDKCIGCTVCELKCPTDTISGKSKELYVIHPEGCIDCGVCAIYCPVSCIQDQFGNLVERIKPKDIPKAKVIVDRKSTRLNSSHLVISYAVFCLKKKK